MCVSYLRGTSHTIWGTFIFEQSMRGWVSEEWGLASAVPASQPLASGGGRGGEPGNDAIQPDERAGVILHRARGSGGVTCSRILPVTLPSGSVASDRCQPAAWVVMRPRGTGIIRRVPLSRPPLAPPLASGLAARPLSAYPPG